MLAIVPPLCKLQWFVFTICRQFFSAAGVETEARFKAKEKADAGAGISPQDLFWAK